MARVSGFRSLLKYGNISSKKQMTITDKFLHIIESETNMFAVDALLDYLHGHFLSHRLTASYIDSVGQQLMVFIKFKVSTDKSADDNDPHFVVVLSAIKVLCGCLRLLEESTLNSMHYRGEYLQCTALAIIKTLQRVHALSRPELLWSMLHDAETMISKYGEIVEYWNREQVLGAFGVVFTECHFVRVQKLKLLCLILECLCGAKSDAIYCNESPNRKRQEIKRMNAGKSEEIRNGILSVLDSYWTDCVDMDMMECIMENVQNTIHRLVIRLQQQWKKSDEAQSVRESDTLSLRTRATMNRLFGMLATNLVDSMSLSVELFLQKYAYSVHTVQSILILFRRYDIMRYDDVNQYGISQREQHHFLQAEYHHHLVQCVVSCYLRFVGKTCSFPTSLVKAVIFWTGEYCLHLEHEMVFGVFNSLLPTFTEELPCIQLCALTAIVKIYCKMKEVSDVNADKMTPLMHHILELGASTKEGTFPVDVRSRGLFLYSVH